MPTLNINIAYDNLTQGETTQMRTRKLIVDAVKTRFNDQLNNDIRPVFQSIYTKLNNAVNTSATTINFTAAEGQFIKSLFQSLTCSVDDAINLYKLESLIP